MCCSELNVAYPILNSRSNAVANELKQSYWYNGVVGSLLGAGYGDVKFDCQIRVPTFYLEKLSIDQSMWSIFAELAIAAGFGGTHLVAWNFVFPWGWATRGWLHDADSAHRHRQSGSRSAHASTLVRKGGYD